MIGINDSSRFVVFVGSYSRTLQARQKQMKKEEQFGFFTQTENRRILEITSPRKSKKKKKILIFDNDKILSSLHTIYKNITQLNDRMHYIIMQDSRSTEIICQKLNDN